MLENEAAGEKGEGLAGRMLGVFFSPGRTFAALAACPDWVWPLLLTSVVSGASAFVEYKPVIVPMQMQKMEERDPPIPAEQLAKIEDQMQTPAAQIASGIAPAVVVWVFVLLQAAILFFLGSIVLGGESSFRRVFAVTAYASLIYALGTVVQTPVHLWATHSMDPVLGLGFLIPADAGSAGLRFVRGILLSIDAFALWQMAVLAVGVAKAFGKRTSFGATCAIALWGVGAIISGIATALSPGAAGG